MRQVQNSPNTPQSEIRKLTSKTEHLKYPLSSRLKKIIEEVRDLKNTFKI